jgi:hypothetical protein
MSSSGTVPDMAAVIGPPPPPPVGVNDHARAATHSEQTAQRGGTRTIRPDGHPDRFISDTPPIRDWTAVSLPSGAADVNPYAP